MACVLLGRGMRQLTVRLVVVWGLLWGRAALATILVPMRDADLVRTSALVATGEVRRIETRELRDGRILTEVSLAVERLIKGRLRGRHVVVTVPGGTVGDRGLHVFGTAEFTQGEHVLVFLKRTGEGRLRTNAMALGKYHLTDDGSAVRTEPTRDARPAAEFLADLAALAGGADEDVPSGRVAADVTRSAVVERYTFLGNPPSRWADGTVTYKLANADSTLGMSATKTAVDGALAAWTNVASATVDLADGGSAGTARSVAGGTCDGKNTIQFNDPFGEVQDLVNCSGVLAVGGFCDGPGSIDVNGVTFNKISEGDLTVNNGFGACFPAIDLAEVVTHEIGHSIGMGHSSENLNEPNPVLKDATMFAYAHFDGRGASVHQDDIAGISAAYPASATNDADGDGVPDASDHCPGTAAGKHVDAQGCACGQAGHVSCDDQNICTVDTCDDATAQCVNTPIDCTDTDGDGHPDVIDQCPNTPQGLAVDATGCACADAGHTSCDDNDACTTDGCDVATGGCTHTAVNCDDGNGCTADSCDPATGCVNTPSGDADGDGTCDLLDNCPLIPNADPTDADGDGVGDVCECTGDAPGQCVPGTGKKNSRCYVEWRPAVAATVKHGLPADKLVCHDGDPTCDQDGVAGQCTFGVLLCINNIDPRFPACTPWTTSGLKVLAPSAGAAARSTRDAANAATLATALDLTAQTKNQCSAPLSLQVATRGTHPGSKTFKVKTTTTTGNGTAVLKLTCLPATS
jgi:hypothetical protein